MRQYQGARCPGALSATQRMIDLPPSARQSLAKFGGSYAHVDRDPRFTRAHCRLAKT